MHSVSNVALLCNHGFHGQLTMTNLKHVSKLIILMAPLAGMGIDIYAPALPLIHQKLHVSEFYTGLTMTVYLLGYAVGLITMGPLTDSFGRVKVLRITLIGFIFVTGLILFATNITELLILRALQGIFVAGPGIIFKVLISDFYKEKELRKISNDSSIAWALGPVVAPFIGGVLSHHLGWQVCFAFLLLYAVILLILQQIFLTESNPKFIRFKLSVLLKNYSMVVSHKVFMMFVLALALCYGTFVIFNVSGPFIIQKYMGYSSVVYGNCALALGLSYLIGISINKILTQKIAINKIVYTGVITLGLANSSLLATGLLEINNLVVIIACIVLSYFSIGLIFSNLLASCLLMFPNNAGTASAVMNASFVAGASALSVLSSIIPNSNQTPLSITYLSIFTIIYILAKKLAANIG